MALLVLCGLASPLSAQHRLCDPGEEDCRQILINHIRAENERLDVAFWFMEDSWIASEIIARWNAGVPVRILMDSEASLRNVRNADRLAEFEAAGIPMRERTTSGIMHWKMMLFAGQGLVEFSGANYSSDAWLPSGAPYTNYVDEVILFTTKASVVNSFKTKFDELWIDTVHYRDYANVAGPQSRVYGIYEKDPELNFPPLESYATRSVHRYYYETQRVDVTMYRITDRRHADAMIDLRAAGVPIRLITEPQQYRDTTRLWHAWNVDRMYMAGVQIMHRAHAGLNHQKSVQLHGLGLSILGSSNWTSPSAHAQEEHNYFTTDRTIFDWLTAQFERKWNNTGGVTENVPFAPLPPDAPADPLPAYQSTGAFTHGLILSWFGGPWAHSYDVYFGTDAGALPLVASRLPLGPSQKPWERQSFALEQPLQPNTTYYWRVVGRTAAEMTTISPMWVFVTGAADTQSPTVSITAPAAGTTVEDTVTISAGASDNTVLSRVEFLVDGVMIGHATTSPYQTVWNTETAAAGTHTLQARAIDAAGNVGVSAVITVTVPDTADPVVTMTAPGSGATLRGEVVLEASASDNVGIARVEFLVGGKVVGFATSPPYRVTWDASGQSEGTVTLAARALDGAGNAATSAAVGATIDHPDPPTLAAVEAQVVTQDRSVTVAISVGDTDSATEGLVLSGSASDPALLPASGITFGGTGVSRTVRLTPATGKTGRTDVSLTVSDGVLTASRTFALTVVPCTFGVAATLSVPAAAVERTLAIVATPADCSWTASSETPWLTLAGTGTGSGQVGVSIAVNTSSLPREGVLSIADRTVVVTQAGSDCAYSVILSTNRMPANGGSGTILVQASPVDCTWFVASSVPWLQTDGGALHAGGGPATFSVAPNPTGRVRIGTLTVGGQKLEVSQDAAPPKVSLDTIALNFGAAVSDGVFTAVTPPQTIRMSRDGEGAIAWTAAASAPWITVTPSSGAGDAVVSVGVRHVPGMVPLGELQGAVEISTSGAASTPGPIAVTLRVTPTGHTEAPFGGMETPADGATGVTGSIAVTGWALDDVGVSAVRVYRNCVEHDPLGACQRVLDQDLVLVGEGAFIEGARPDVEAVFPAAPNARAAGWGLMVLTNMLPHLPDRRGSGGQGDFTLYAVAVDADGHQSLLGRRRISLDNDHASKPFGAIDTPGNGAVASGVVANFGWALTPGTARIPVDGSTIRVYIDGRPVSGVTYGLCRGTAPNPVAVGTCDDDVARLFPRYRNITEGRGGIGVGRIDTRGLANGLHTIAWVVTDDQGRADGIGSRYFRVSNPIAASASSTAIQHGTLAAVANIATGGDRGVRGRVGFEPGAPLEVLTPDSSGLRHARIQELGRLEMVFADPVTGGYLEANGRRRPLPAGSALEGARFTWAPGAGFVGPYDLTFTTAEAEIPVRVTILPRHQADGPIRAWIDTPATGSVAEPGFQVAGWALDAAAWNGTGIGAVHIWAIRRDSKEEATFLGIAALDGSRPDVGAHFGAQFERAGWGLTAAPLPPGDYNVIAYFWSVRTARFEDARAVQITVR